MLKVKVSPTGQPLIDVYQYTTREHFVLASSQKLPQTLAVLTAPGLMSTSVECRSCHSLINSRLSILRHTLVFIQTFYFSIVLELEKNCKDITESSCIPHTQLPLALLYSIGVFATINGTILIHY